MKKLFLCTIVLSAFIFPSCRHSGTSALTVRQGYDTLILISTNDVHARLDNMPKLAAYVQSQRDSFAYVALLSAGDIFTGSPVVDQYAERGYPMIDVMNKIGYMANTIGNHAFDYGQETLHKRIAQAAFPFLCANADFSATVLKDEIKPYILVEINGLKLAILGLLQLDASGKPATLPANVAHIEFTNGLLTAKEYSALRDSGHVFIVLSHLGVLDDVQLALQFPQADVIVGGHSHTVLPQGIDTNGVLITQTGAYLQYIGKTVLILENGKVVSKKSTLVNVASLTAVDTAMQRLVNKYKNNAALKKVVGVATADIVGPNALGNFITDALAVENHWDIAFTNNGGIRVPAIPKGNITMEQIYELDPFADGMVAYRMSYSEVKDFVKQSYNRNKKIELQIAGAKYTIVRNASDTTSAVEVLLTNPDGRPLDTLKSYQVGMSSYLSEVYMPLITHREAGEDVPGTTSATLVNYLSHHKAKPTPPRVFVK
jgi:2',3'-cyclic-nucleotide 2'-phosphodiesterase (5'-nucleotidase family)